MPVHPAQQATALRWSCPQRRRCPQRRKQRWSCPQRRGCSQRRSQRWSCTRRQKYRSGVVLSAGAPRAQRAARSTVPESWVPQRWSCAQRRKHSARPGAQRQNLESHSAGVVRSARGSVQRQNTSAGVVYSTRKNSDGVVHSARGTYSARVVDQRQSTALELFPTLDPPLWVHQQKKKSLSLLLIDQFIDYFVSHVRIST